MNLDPTSPEVSGVPGGMPDTPPPFPMFSDDELSEMADPNGMPEEPAEPEPEPDPLAAIDDAVLLAILNEGYHRSKEDRAARNRLNDKNWRALNREFEFLARKQPGQSKIVIPALETSLEQVCGTLSSQLVGFKNYFTCEWEGGDPPLPELDEDEAAAILRRQLERLSIAGNYMPTAYGMQSLIYDSLKVGLIESEVCWKVSVVDHERQVYTMPPEGSDPSVGPGVQTKIEKRLKIELIPYADHYPDPSPAAMFDIHEVEVPISELPSLGFTKEQVAAMRGQVSTEKEEQRRIRSGNSTALNGSKHRVLLREYWGDLVHPDTGELLARNVCFMACGSSLIVKRPQRIIEILWHDRRPLITVPLIPTPLSSTHHAFLDIAVPLVETESELTNLVIDGGFNATHGIKEVRDWMLENPSVLANGLVPGITLMVAEGRGDGQVVRKVETGTLEPEVLEVLDRASRMRLEAFRISDLQLGRLPAHKESATAITEVKESSDDLFSTMAVRFEDRGIEPLIELSWLTMWQFLDDFSALANPDHRMALESLSPQERFVLMANGVRFKVQGYKYMQGAVKETQKLMTLQNMVASNPAQQAVWEQEFSPKKTFRVIYRALGVDPSELKRGPEEPFTPPDLLAGAAGNPGGGGGTPPGGPGQGPLPPPNPGGVRGAQFP